MTVNLTDVTVVVPSVGRPSLVGLLDTLAAEPATLGGLVVVDDRRAPDGPIAGGAPVSGTVVHGGGRGPAAARNVGWRQAGTEWIAFLDDDVVPSPGWAATLHVDLDALAPDVAASQAAIDVPLPRGRAATDRERNVARLQGAPWITADLAVRRAALDDIGGFDERFQRAYREDTDLALRLEARGWRLAEGRRRTSHPVGPAPWWASVAAQRGNRDDALRTRCAREAMAGGARTAAAPRRDHHRGGSGAHRHVDRPPVARCRGDGGMDSGDGRTRGDPDPGRTTQRSARWRPWS